MSILNETKVNCRNFPVLETLNLKLKTINNETTERVERISTPVPKEFGMPRNHKIKWYKRKLYNKEYDLLIGMDLLKNITKNISFENKEITLVNGKKLKLFSEEKNSFECLELSQSKEVDLSHLNHEEKKEISRVLREYKNLIYHEGDQLTNTNSITHKIQLTTDQQIHSKLYRLPPQHEKEVEKQVIEMEKQGIIRKSNSRYASPIVVVAKKMDSSGVQKFRVCVDYRKLNEFTIDDKFPLPNIDGILDKLGRAQYFTTLDLAKGYHQIKMHPSDIHKTAFVTPKGLYEYVRMPFGLKNAPATFQRLMNEILRDYINKICVVYLDDILIFSTSLTEHIQSVRKIFNKLSEHNLKVQFDKCSFLKKETEFLGHVLTDKGMKPNPNKIQCIKEYPLPGTEKQLRGFLGVTGYYRKFIEGYAKLAQPMTKYLKKGNKINKTDPEYITAFENLKTNIINHPILKFPDFEKPFELTTDASNYAIGAVLSQGKQPVCYASRTLNDHERNYSTTDKEFLAIVWAVTYFRPYLWGRKFRITTDHLPIKYLNKKYSGKEFSQRTQRWLLKLQEYQFDIEYLKGKENKVADFLSRMPPEQNIDQIEESSDGEPSDMATIHSEQEQQLDHFPIKETIVNLYKTQLILTNEDRPECETIHGNRIININLTKSDEELIEIFKEYIGKGKIGIFTDLSYQEYNRIQQILIKLYNHDRELTFVKVTKRAKDIVSLDELNKQIALYHTKESLHSGIVETYYQLKDKLYYPKLFEQIRKQISNCQRCLTIKYDRKPIKPKFQISETPSEPNQILHVDVFHVSKRYFLTLIDKLTKMAYIYDLPNINWVTKRIKFQEHISKFGKPKKIIADNEFQTLIPFFNSQNITHHFTTPRTHTGNSDIERFHCTLQEKLTAIEDENLTLTEKLFIAVQNYNSRYHSTIKCTPNEASKKSSEELKAKINDVKQKTINKINEGRESYVEGRKIAPEKVHWRRGKDVPRYEIRDTKNRAAINLKRPRLFTDHDVLQPITYSCPRSSKPRGSKNREPDRVCHT